MDLAPLDGEAIARVASDAVGAEPDDALLELAESVDGNPFLLTELLAGLREEQLVRVSGGRAELVTGRMPLRVRDGMDTRLARLSERGRQVVTVAAVLGRRFGAGDLAAMLDRPAAELEAPIAELLATHLFVEDGDRLVLRHDLTRQAVRDSLPASVRRALERQAAGVMLAGGASPAEVATRLVAGADPGDEQAITVLQQAAEAVSTTDPGSAADLGRHALTLTPSGHRLRGQLVAQTAVWLHAALRGEEATAFVDTELRDILPVEQQAEVRLSIARMFGLSPDVRAVAGRRAVTLPGLSAPLRAQHLSALTYNLLAGGRVAEARAVLADAHDAAAATEDPVTAFTLTFAEGCLEHVDADFGAALVTFDTALQIARETTGQDALERVTAWWRCEALAALGRRAESMELATEQIAAARRDRQAWALQLFEVWRGRHLLYQGRIPDALTCLAKQFDLVGDARVAYPPDAAGIVAAGRIALHTGDERLTRRTAAAAAAMLEQSPPGVRRHGAWLLALQAMAANDPALARRRLCAMGEQERLSILPRFPIDITDEAQLVRIGLASGDQELAESAAAAAVRRAGRNPGAHCLAASAAYADGLLTGSVAALTEAAAQSEGEQRPLALAAVLEDLGAAQVRDGATQDGVASLDRALGVFAERGASADAARVRGRLRELGLRRRQGTAAGARGRWAGMTESELAVARLVAEGMTNREVAERLFISPHTVSGHLRRVFAKLEINSRVELTRLSHERRTD